MTNTKKFDALWKHVTGVCGNVPSPMMDEVGSAMRAAAKGMARSKSFAFLAPCNKVAGRIAKYTGDCQKDGTALLAKVDCEWLVGNADLEMWSDLMLFGERAFPKEWEFLGGAIGGAILKARVWQCYQRYVERGRLVGEHRRPLAKLIWDADVFRGDWVSLYVQGKRPFGDSGRAEQMGEIMGWKWPEDDDGEPGMPDELVERAWELFDELRFAIHDAVKPKKRRVGR